MDLGPASTLKKRPGRKGKGPYVGVRLRGGRWISEIRIPKTSTRIWLGSHHSAQKAARAYDAALYCLKGERGGFNFPNNRRPDLANRSVGSLPIDEIQCIAAEFSCLDESVQILEKTSETSPILPLRASNLSLEPPVLPDPQDANGMGANKVGELYVPAYVPQEEPYVPTFVLEEPCVPAYVPETAPVLHGNLLLDEWLSLDGDWMGNFP